MQEPLGAIGALVMIGALVLYVGSLALGAADTAPGRRAVHARLRVGSFAVVFIGAGLFILTRPADYAVPAAIGLFAAAALVALMTFAIRVR